MVMKEAGAEPTLGENTTSLGEAHRKRHGRPALKQPSFNWNAPDKYVELLHCEMEITDILKTKVYKLTEEEEVPIIKNWVG